MTSPIIYLNKEELRNFLSSSKTSAHGVAYEWENENVFHLHTAPRPHSFGRTHKVLFAKEKTEEASPGDFVVVVEPVKEDPEAKVFRIQEDGSWEPLNVCFIPAKSELHSRSKGILEVDILKDKRVFIIGLGSFGSQIAIELAKAGVGYFSLADFDRVELHNLARHTATLNDLGRLKTDVIEEAIKGKNPYAHVDKFPININEHLGLMEDEVAKADIVICTTDNNESRFNISSALVLHEKTGIFGRAVTRAEGGDVLRYHPGGPCYCCLIGNEWFRQAQEEITNAASARRNGQIAAYVSDEDADAVVQVGLSADIEPICNMMVKIALMELSRGVPSGISCLEEELVYDYYMWANRRERRHRNWAPMPGAGAKPTIMRWYGARIQKNENCALCSCHEARLDEGEALEENYGDLIQKTDLTGVSLEE